MLSTLFSYGEPLGFLASRGYKITCTRTDLILPCGREDVEYNDTPFARVALHHAVKSIGQGLSPCIVDRGALAAAVPCYVRELGLVGYEADLAAAELFGSDALKQSDGAPNANMFLVEAPTCRVDDHAAYDDDGRITFSGFDSQEPFYKVFDKVEVQRVTSVKALLNHFAANRLTYWDDGDFVFASNTKSAYYGCPPSIKHLGFELVRRDKPSGSDTVKLSPSAAWDTFFEDFEDCPTEDMLELMTKSPVLRKKFLDLRNENGAIDGRTLRNFRDKLFGLGKAVSLPEMIAELRTWSESAAMRFLLLMELRGLLRWSCGACHFV